MGDPAPAWEAAGGSWSSTTITTRSTTWPRPSRSLIPGVSLADGYRFADRIHNTGCAIVWSGPREDAEEHWEELDGAGLTMAPLESG